MLVALVPLLTLVLGGTALPAAAAALTFTQWATIGDAALSAAPEVLNLVARLHPLFDHVIAGVHASNEATDAQRLANNWLARNAEAAVRAQEERDRNY